MMAIALADVDGHATISCQLPAAVDAASRADEVTLSARMRR